MMIEKSMTPKRMQQLIHKTLSENKGQDISVLDVRKLTDITDYMIIVTGTSLRHAQTLADKVVEALHAHKVKAIGVEGLETSDWVLVDFGDVVVHVMLTQARKFYSLEKLWDEGLKEEVVGED